MAINDLYRVELHQSLSFQRLINVFHYRQRAGVGTATNLIVLFQSEVVAALAAACADDLSFDEVRVYNLTEPLDVVNDTTVVPGVGGIADSSIPLQLALSFKSGRPSLAWRNSWKRFGGIASGILTGQVFDVANANVVGLAAALGEVLVSGVSEWVPCQVSYSYPGNGGSPTITHNYDITSWAPVAQPATQNTRKLGRGI